LQSTVRESIQETVTALFRHKPHYVSVTAIFCSGAGKLWLEEEKLTLRQCTVGEIYGSLLIHWCMFKTDYVMKAKVINSATLKCYLVSSVHSPPLKPLPLLPLRQSPRYLPSSHPVIGRLLPSARRLHVSEKRCARATVPTNDARVMWWTGGISYDARIVTIRVKCDAG